MVLISFALSAPEEEYQPFFDAMLGDRNHYRVSDTCYLVDTDGVGLVKSDLIKYLAPADRIIIADITRGKVAGQLGPKGKEWISKHLFGRQIING